MIAIHTGPAMRVSEYRRPITPFERTWNYLDEDERETVQRIAGELGVSKEDALKSIVREYHRDK